MVQKNRLLCYNNKQNLKIMTAVTVLLLAGFAFFKMWFEEIFIPSPRKGNENSEGVGREDQIKQTPFGRGLATSWNIRMLVQIVNPIL